MTALLESIDYLKIYIYIYKYIIITVCTLAYNVGMAYFGIFGRGINYTSCRPNLEAIM